MENGVKTMKEIKLLKLILQDFQGGTITLDTKGKDIYIFSANAVGKTRLVSAFSWLLFSKDALGRSDFEIKNIILVQDGEEIREVDIPNKAFDELSRDDPDYNVPEFISVKKKFPTYHSEIAHGLEHTVEAELDINGEPCILKKVFSEKWQKKRGNINREFAGHTTNYFVNGVPIQEKDYIAQIAEIAGDESRFRLLTSPTTFPQLHWQKQRTLLLEICGDISDADIIDSDTKLKPLITILGKRTLEDHRKIIMARRSEINKEMEKIPIRIDEVHRGIPDITGIDESKAKNEAQRLEIALNDAKLKLQGVDTGGIIAELSKHLSGLNVDLRKMEDSHRSESLATLNRLNQQISEVQVVVNALKRRIGTLNIDHLNGQLGRIEGQLSSLRARWMQVDGETFQSTIQDTCPACGQALPTDRVQSARDKALATFNQSKAQRLTEINSGGEDLKSQKERIKSEIFSLKKEREGIERELPEAEAKIQTLTSERDTLKQSSEDFSGLPHWSETFGEIEAYEEEIKAEREGKIQDIEKIKGEIATTNLKLLAAKEQVDKFVRREQGEKRIEELKADEKKLSAEYEKLEGELYLIEQFIKMKVSLLTHRINAKFETVRFKLFNQLINGGLEECCEITVGGIPYNGGLNNGARINAGLEIVKVLQQHYQLKAPVFADNAEAVNNLVNVGCQMIRLYVSEDKILRVEIK